jgi:hypothetical protein
VQHLQVPRRPSRRRTAHVTAGAGAAGGITDDDSDKRTAFLSRLNNLKVKVETFSCRVGPPQCGHFCFDGKRDSLSALPLAVGKPCLRMPTLNRMC